MVDNYRLEQPRALASTPPFKIFSASKAAHTSSTGSLQFCAHGSVQLQFAKRSSLRLDGDFRPKFGKENRKMIDKLEGDLCDPHELLANGCSKLITANGLEKAMTWPTEIFLK